MPVAAKPRLTPMPPLTPAMVALTYLGEKWTLPIIEVIHRNRAPMRFVTIQRALTRDGRGISTEQLRQRLKRMVEDGLLTRERFREVPPRVDYGLTERAVLAAEVVLPVLTAWAELHANPDGTLRARQA